MSNSPSERDSPTDETRIARISYTGHLFSQRPQPVHLQRSTQPLLLIPLSRRNSIHVEQMIEEREMGEFWLAFVPMFVAVDPVGMIPVFMSGTRARGS